MQKNYFRKCSKCGITLGYSTKIEMLKAERKSGVCISCSFSNRKAEKRFFRNCPSCNKQIGHTDTKERNKANREGRLCRSCSSIKKNSNEELRKRRSEKMKGVYSGIKNPFYGKKHSKETIDKLKSIANDRDYSYTRTESFKNISKHVGEKNGMFGKSVFSVWVKKFGREIAERLSVESRKKTSEKVSGKKNPMYGKPTPEGSGCGWSGWYKGWFFRSLHELSYMIFVIEKNGISWVSAERKDLDIKYVNEFGKERTYHADFLLDGNILVEVKPERLMSLSKNILKRDAAIAFCKLRNMQYRMVDVKLITEEELVKLRDCGDLSLIDRFNVRLEEIKCKLERRKK